MDTLTPDSWKIGDAFTDTEGTTYVIIGCDKVDVEYLNVNAAQGTCPSLLVRARDTLTFYMESGKITFKGNVRAGW